MHQVPRRRHHQHAQQRRGDHAAHHRRGNAGHYFGAGAAAPQDGQQAAGHHHGHRHGLRAHAQHGAFTDGSEQGLLVVRLARCQDVLRPHLDEGC